MKVPTSIMRGSRDRAVALVVGLWLLAILSLTSLGLAYRARIAIKTTNLSRDRLQAFYACKAMVARAILELEKDQNTFDSRNESWCRHSSFQDEGWLIEMGLDSAEGMKTQYAVWDESGKININVDAQQELLYELGEETLESDQASAILDWIDADSATRPGGAESDYYARLTPAYEAKNGSIHALDELLHVKGMTEKCFLGMDMGTVDDDEAWAGGETQHMNGLRAFLTVYGDGVININTTSEQVLAAISGISENTAKTIANSVRGPDGTLGTDDDDPFEAIEEFASIRDITEYELAVLENSCKTTSNFFSIACCATLPHSNVRKTIRAIAERDPESREVRIVAWREN